MRLVSSFAFFAAVTLAAGCKSKSSNEATSGSAAPVAAEPRSIDAAAQTDLVFGPGENYFGGTRSATNVYEWKTSDGSNIRLVIVSTGKDADGRETGVLRVYRDGKGVPVGRSFSVTTTGDHWAELKQLPNDRVLFRYGDSREDRRARNALLLRYDAETKEVRIEKRWVGGGKAEEPAWVVSGEYKPADGTGDLCGKIVARMVACEKDEKFRKSLVAREDDDAARASLLAGFDKDLSTWKTPAGIKHQCERWGGDEYVETTFSDRAKLDGLAKDAADAKLSCELFGAEIVDEGGLPQLSLRK